jgi:hypothetical protein
MLEEMMKEGRVMRCMHCRMPKGERHAFLCPVRLYEATVGGKDF